MAVNRTPAPMPYLPLVFGLEAVEATGIGDLYLWCGKRTNLHCAHVIDISRMARQAHARGSRLFQFFYRSSRNQIEMI
jgi:hypothetical protein